MDKAELTKIVTKGVLITMLGTILALTPFFGAVVSGYEEKLKTLKEECTQRTEP